MLVWPSAMIWPSTLVNTALFNTLHSVEDEGLRETKDRTMSREKFFAVSTGAAFVWSWFPNYLAGFLQYFDWVTWIAPTNQKVNMIFGYQHVSLLGQFTDCQQTDVSTICRVWE